MKHLRLEKYEVTRDFKILQVHDRVYSLDNWNHVLLS